MNTIVIVQVATPSLLPSGPIEERDKLCVLSVVIRGNTVSVVEEKDRLCVLWVVVRGNTTGVVEERDKLCVPWIVVKDACANIDGGGKDTP